LSTIPLPALGVTQQPGPLQQYASLSSLMGQRLQQQTAQLQQTGLQQENQQRGLALQDQQTLRELAPQFMQKDDNGAPTGFNFEGFANAALGAKVNPQTINQMRLQAAQTTSALAGAQESVRNNELAKNKAAYEALEGVRNLADPQERQTAYQTAIPNLQRLGVDTSKFPSQVPGDNQLQDFEIGLGMHAQMLSDASTKADTMKAASQAKQADVETALKQVTLDRIKNATPGSFDSQIDQLAPLAGPDGKPGPMASFNKPLKVAVNGALSRGDYETATKILSDGFNQIGDIAKETNPSVIAARGQIAGATAAASEQARLQFGNNKDARDKIESTVLKPYQDKMSEIGELQSAIGQAQSGNIAAARATLYKVIGVAQPQGTHRVAPTEVSGFQGMGSIPQRIQGSIANALSGDPWTPQMVQDIKSFGDAQAGVAQDNLNRGIDSTNKLYGTSVGQGLKGGTGSVSVTDPRGKTHIFPDQKSADNFKQAAGIK
jgi:hypothetical protein